MVAAVRELHEETGIRSARILAAKDQWLQYDKPTRTRSQFSGGWVCYKGQTQKWCAGAPGLGAGVGGPGSRPPPPLSRHPPVLLVDLIPVI